jgi:hypothetical protein
MFACVFLSCNLLTGCGADTHEGLVQETIQQMRAAGTEVSIITAKVRDATDEAKKANKSKLDLTAAGKAADKLKETGTRIVLLKQRIDYVKSKITPEEREEYAKNNKSNLNDAFKKLLQEKEDLRKALADAEAIDKDRTDELRKKIVEAESPFEAQAR